MLRRSVRRIGHCRLWAAWRTWNNFIRSRIEEAAREPALELERVKQERPSQTSIEFQQTSEDPEPPQKRPRNLPSPAEDRNRASESDNTCFECSEESPSVTSAADEATQQSDTRHERGAVISLSPTVAISCKFRYFFFFLALTTVAIFVHRHGKSNEMVVVDRTWEMYETAGAIESHRSLESPDATGTSTTVPTTPEDHQGEDPSVVADISTVDIEDAGLVATHLKVDQTSPESDAPPHHSAEIESFEEQGAKPHWYGQDELINPSTDVKQQSHDDTYLITDELNHELFPTKLSRRAGFWSRICSDNSPEDSSWTRRMFRRFMCREASKDDGPELLQGGCILVGANVACPIPDTML